MPDPTAILAQLPTDKLESLTEAIEGQWLTLDSSRAAIANIVGGEADCVQQAFVQLQGHSFTNSQSALLLRTALATKKFAEAKSVIADLVISGPDVPGIPTAATEAVVQSLFQEAKSEIILAGYAFHKTKHILQRLAERMAEDPGLKVILHADIGRAYRDTSTNEAIVARFAEEFSRKNWHWEQKPEIYYDPRALAKDAELRACLHTKAIIIDRKKMLITSANFTEAAQKRNIEAGVLLASYSSAEQLAGYFEKLRSTMQLVRLVW